MTDSTKVRADCLICGDEIENGVFCPSCERDYGPTEFLPEEMETPRLNDLEEGQIGYMDPVYLYPDSNRKLWIAGNPPTYSSSYGKAQMRVKLEGGVIVVERDSIRERTYTVQREIYIDDATDNHPVILVNKFSKG